MAQSEGSDVRRAFDGPDIDHDKLIDFITARNNEDSERASDAGESRQKIGEFLEETNMNAKALSVCRTILKQKSTDKGMDIIRSLEATLPMLRAHLGGQQPEMEFDQDEPPEMIDPDEAEAMDDGSLPAQSYPDDFTLNEEIADEADAFDAQLAEVAGQ